MPSCKEYQVLCAIAVDGMLSAQENEMLKEHVRTCATCRAYLEDLVAMRDLWEETAVEVPANLHDTIMEAVKQECSVVIQKPNKLARPRFFACIGAVACLALVVSGSLGNFLGRKVVAPEMPMTASVAPAEAATADHAPAVPEVRIMQDADTAAAESADQTGGQEDAVSPNAVDTVDVPQRAIPDSLRAVPFASVFVVQGGTELPENSDLTPLESNDYGQFYSVPNDTAVQEGLTLVLTEGGYTVSAVGDVPLPLTRDAEKSLWIVLRDSDGE